MYKTAAITAENSFTDALPLHGFFNVSVQGTFVATVSLLRSFDEGSSWEEVETWTAPVSTVWFEPTESFQKFYSDPGVQYKLGVVTGDFTSGTINARIGV